MSELPDAADPAPRHSRMPAWAKWGLVPLALAVLAWGVVKFLRMEVVESPKRRLPQVVMVQPPPPPPKPPEKPPEPPKVKEEVKIDPPKPADEPKPSPQAPPPGPLGVDAQGNGPGDGFGLAGRPGGRDLTLGGGGGGLSNMLFANSVARHIAQELARVGTLRNMEYRVDLRIWITPDGRIERQEIAQGSGDPAIDRLIVDGIARIGALRQTVPDHLTQPLRIRLTSADA